jgi:hypothetical protein
MQVYLVHHAWGSGELGWFESEETSRDFQNVLTRYSWVCSRNKVVESIVAKIKGHLGPNEPCTVQ